MRIALLCFLTALQTAIFALASDQLDSNLFSARLVWLLTSKNFSCNLTSPESGYRCRGKLTSYPEPINFFFPVQLSQKPDILAVHLHGFNVCGSTACHFNLNTGDGDYGKFLSQKSNHTLLVIPESTGKVTTYSSYFQTPQAFDHFIQEIQAISEISNFLKLKLSSHSGADRIMERFATWEINPNILTPSQYLKKVQAVALFDSFYEYRKSFPVWIAKLAKENPYFYFLGSYVHNSPSDRQNAYMYMQWLQLMLPATPQIHYLDVRTTHFGIMKNGQMTEFLQDK